MLARGGHEVKFDRAEPELLPGVEISPIDSGDSVGKQLVYARGRFTNLQAMVLIYPPAQDGQATPKPLLRSILNPK